MEGIKTYHLNALFKLSQDYEFAENTREDKQNYSIHLSY